MRGIDKKASSQTRIAGIDSCGGMSIGRQRDIQKKFKKNPFVTDSESLDCNK
jgi:hypothetical protein